MNSIAKIIKKETGLKINDFCEQELQTQYKAFFARIRNARLYPAEIFYIVYRTKKPVEELFGRPWHELLISSQGGTIADKVRGIIDGMTEDEKNEIGRLLGFDRNTKHAPDQHLVQIPESVKYPLTPEEATPEPPAEENLIDKLKDLFIKTY